MNIVKQYAVALILALASSIVAETLPPQFEGSNANAITFDADGNIHLESFSQEPSTIQSSLAHESDENDTLELVVRVTDRNITDSGWQPSLVLFFAPGATDIKDVTTPDNGFYNFEGMVTAFMNHRMYPTLGSYFNSNVKQEDGTFLSDSSYSETLPLPTTGTALKLSRRGGKISSYYSLDDGTTWSQIGSEHLLAPEYQSAPLKVGYRLHMEYQTSYRFETIPSIVSGGETEVSPPPAALSYFDGLNADLDSAECTDLDGCTLTGDSNVAKLLSRESFGGDVVFTSELTNRPIFGSGYQSGLWLFMVPANATLSSISDDDDVFRDEALATVGDKIYASTDYTYVYSSSNGVDQYLGQSWKNIDGFYKLQRINGKVGAFISPNGKIWTQIGNEIELPDELKDVPVKLGYRVQKNWAPGYEFRVRSDVSSDRVISTGNCPIETDPATNTSRYGEMKFCVRSSLGYSYGAANTFQEVNFIESLVKIRYNLESGFCVADFNVEPKERIETTQEEAYALQAWLCDTGSMTNYFNPDRQLPTRVTNYDTVGGTDYFNQGALITVCVSPDNVAYAEGIRMSSLTDFTWTRDTFSGLPSLEVQQTAIENSSPAGNYLTYYDNTACSGAEWCTFSSILVADFYINTGSVTGSGTAQLEFARRRLEEGDQRKLQGEDSSSTFDLNLGVIGVDDGPAALKTAGATSFGFYSLYCVTTLVGLALLA